ncbi:MAG: thioredoxin domain-containing protein [Okeania sp. SIO2G4]|uniref:thioredoxin domain-containing protein n=1 Tax=unclassified Okeania TaxID=2634635 RepID=UPI0013B85BD7|nr:MULTISPECIES: thioredoxin domain-containing protein [unclassified Okeania]NEP04054.1 thioredoxin domain-containing protein [Okeania sp. SIO4D6]NEP39048.1 thioredoxin domain-containing protein [Okeania sp. SIO2H7]NEP73133.1 thioredoxin domain-containing protein [Okeania sp. SIO2G5]NEP93956.1 thioredoxin domain-containing protein [Okeania sp. SIO2F5]NEQ94214.1 thioredoxin domain-containing protein [Okeania sp. SIO2G4]
MTNRLAKSQSLYLRKHAENPVDWWPWSEEALETARREDKPIFLSIGYSSCHWCTVMEGEAFSDEKIAQYLNEKFLPIKVDREERPDVDSIYMQALQMLTGQGGWPLNIFLTPDDLTPFVGGTYFPVEPRYGRPGFLEVLQKIRGFYDIEKNKLNDLKSEMLEGLRKSVLLPEAEDLSEEILQKGLEVSTAIISDRYSQQSFPMIPYGQGALQGTRFNFESQYDGNQICLQRGLNLSLGGIYDHVAGGFHRYTVDATWTVPHFEKMLYDNGQIVEYLANLWSAGHQEAAFKRGIIGTINWLKREMTAPDGFFYAAQDADSFTTPDEAEPEEGAFYIWNYQELENLLTSEELSELSEQFFIASTGNFEGKIVLQRKQAGELSETLENSLSKLFELRYGAKPSSVKTFPPATNNQEAKNNNWPGRIPAVTDTKMIVAWNSLMISGLARAATVFNNSEYLELAVNAANFIIKNQWVNGRFHRLNYEGKPAVMAQSEDYALFIKALLDLQQASINSSNTNFWLDTAVKLQDEFDEFLWSLEASGYYNSPSDVSGELILRERNYIDNATPAANGIAVANLVRLSLLTEELYYLDRAESALTTFSSIMKKSPQACPSLFIALDWYRNQTLVRTSQAEISSLITEYFPTTIYKVEADLPKNYVGLVCQGLICKKPSLNKQELLEHLEQSQNRWAK